MTRSQIQRLKRLVSRPLGQGIVNKKKPGPLKCRTIPATRDQKQPGSDNQT